MYIENLIYLYSERMVPLMKRIISVVTKQLKRALKTMYIFLEKHGFFNALIENIIKLVIFIIVLYKFKVVVW
mgnify:CR=1 FL=1